MIFRRISLQTTDRSGYEHLAGDMPVLARAEGPLALAKAIEVRR